MAAGLAAIVTIVSGCAQIRQTQQRETFQQRVVQAQQVCNSVYADPALNPIRGKVSLDRPDNVTFAMRTNTDYASDSERPAIALWAQKRDECHNAGAPALAMMPGPLSALMEGSHNAINALVAQLYLRKITYGQYAEKTAENIAQLHTAYASVQQALAAQDLAAQQRAQMISNQAVSAWAALIQANADQEMQQQPQWTAPPPQVPQPPQQTWCRQVGTQISCTTQ